MLSLPILSNIIKLLASTFNNTWEELQFYIPAKESGIVILFANFLSFVLKWIKLKAINPAGAVTCVLTICPYLIAEHFC